MNWFDGKPTTVKPLGPYFFCSASSVEYCGVLPHLEATLTTMIALPLKAASVVGSPLSVLSGVDQIPSSSLPTATGAGAVPAAGRLAGSVTWAGLAAGSAATAPAARDPKTKAASASFFMGSTLQ